MFYVLQIFRHDFNYWKIYSDEELQEAENECNYPPRFKVTCDQTDVSKPLRCSFVVSKRKNTRSDTITQYLISKKITGEYIYIAIATMACMHIAMIICLASSFSVQGAAESEVPQLHTDVLTPLIFEEGKYSVVIATK